MQNRKLLDVVYFLQLRKLLMNTMNALIQITILNNCIVAQSKLKTGNQNMRKRIEPLNSQFVSNFCENFKNYFITNRISS
jgi:hypothetical protein